jgi:hypothetical protein
MRMTHGRSTCTFPSIGGTLPGPTPSTWTGPSRQAATPRLADAVPETLAGSMLLLYLTVHASCPLRSLSLLRLVEIILVIRRDEPAGALRSAEFLRVAELSSTLASIYPACRLANELSPGVIPDRVMRATAEAAPRAARVFLDGQRPWSVHRVVRGSLAERFMWASSPGESYAGWYATFCPQLAG